MLEAAPLVPSRKVQESPQVRSPSQNVAARVAAPRRGRSATNALCGSALAVCTLTAACLGDASVGFDRLASASAAPDADAPAAIDSGVPAESAASAGSGAESPLGVELRIGNVATSAASIRCPDSCVRVEVAANGGNPPYTLHWPDGSNATLRMLCPSMNATYTVSVTDSATPQRRAQQAETTLSVQVTACPKSASLCLQNPSLEGSPAFGITWFAPNFFDASSWDDCHATNQDRTPSMPRVAAPISAAPPNPPFPMPTNGQTYVYLESPPPPLHESIGQVLCAPLKANTAYSFKLDLASAPSDGNGVLLGAARLQLYASADPCRRDELLWTSGVLGSSWSTSCVTLKPTQDAVALVLSPIGASPERAAVLVDNLVPVDHCP
jgi:hypothetical protein